MNDLAQQLREFVADRVAEVAARKGIAVTVSDELPLLDGTLLDSVDFLNLLLALDERFGLEVDFSDRDLAEVTRFGAFVAAFAAARQQDAR